MTDEHKKTGQPDRSRINLNELHELRNWAQYFGVAETTIREAVAKVGPTIAAVRTYLANQPRTDNKKSPRSREVKPGAQALRTGQ